MVLPMAIGTLIFSGNYEADIAMHGRCHLTLLAAFQWFNAWNADRKTNLFSK